MNATTGSQTPPPQADAARLERARARVASIPDPEIPVVTLQDLGIVRSVVLESGRVVATLTPTYTGCPATQVIADDVRDALRAEGFHDAEVRLTLSPPWTTDWISAEGRRKLSAYGIAPPGHAASGPQVAVVQLQRRPGKGVTGGIPEADAVACPRCASPEIERISEYGSTPCKALYRCLACREPFDYFKPY